MRGKRRRSSRVIERELKRQKVSDVSYKTVQRTVHRRDLHAFKQRKTSRLSKAHKRGRLKFARTQHKRRIGAMWCSVTNASLNNSKEATHDTTLSGLETKRKDGNYNKTKRLATRQSPAWLERHEVAVVEEWPTKGNDINPIENLWAILDERARSSQQRKE